MNRQQTKDLPGKRGKERQQERQRKNGLNDK